MEYPMEPITMEYPIPMEPLCILSHDEDGQYKPTDDSSTFNNCNMNIDQSGFYTSDPNNGTPNSYPASNDGQTFKMEPLSDGSDCEEGTSHVKRTNIVITAFICDRCKQIFGSEQILLEHHSQCKVNPRMLAGNMNINDPRKLWKKQFKTSAKPKRIIECEICQKRFRQIADLTNHMRSHTGEKPFVCEVCQRTFSQQSNLKVHMRVHSNERPFECDVCDRRFTLMTHKVIHMKSHTIEMPHECETCKKRFAHLSAKITHMKSHTGEKPNKCDSCEKGFTTVGSLRRHQKVHTADTGVLNQLTDLIVTKVETQYEK